MGRQRLFHVLFSSVTTLQKVVKFQGLSSTSLPKLPLTACPPWLGPSNILTTINELSKPDSSSQASPVLQALAIYVTVFICLDRSPQVRGPIPSPARNQVTYRTQPRESKVIKGSLACSQPIPKSTCGCAKHFQNVSFGFNQ